MKKESKLKHIKLFEEFNISIIISGSESVQNEGHQGADTSWTDADGKTITLVEICEYLDDNSVPVIDIDPKSVEELLIKVERDPERVADADLSFPIIITESNGEYTKILDGQHRVAKCLQGGIPKIKARVLDLDTAPEEYSKMFS